MVETNLHASVIVCTRNRAVSLREMLTSLTAMGIPDDTQWEIVVVDNGSTDHTASVVGEFEGKLPVRRVVEATPGLSNARNCGIRAARGRYLLWTDDDVSVDPNWLSAYLAAFKRWPDAAVFGGKIIPLIQAPTPTWFVHGRQLLSGMLAERDFGDAPLPLSVPDNRLPYGANYAVRTREQHRFPYDPAFGVAPGRARLGEEQLVIEAMLNSGATGYWVPDSRVRHRIPPSRQTTAYIRKYYQAEGATVAQIEGDRGAPFLFGAPRWLWLKCPTSWLRFAWLRIAAHAPQWIEALKVNAHYCGMLQYWRETRSRRCRRPAK
ncbi:glycosyltransferase family 2 protein [Reyranella sp.]|uniref:glycosyltransferase family 2 protein n=1 Tax=Reyranella sp. TaxID=1929291 RepID=UPI003D0B4468